MITKKDTIDLNVYQLIKGSWELLIEIPGDSDTTEEQIADAIKDLTERIFDTDRTMLTLVDRAIIFTRDDGPIKIELGRTVRYGK